MPGLLDIRIRPPKPSIILPKLSSVSNKIHDRFSLAQKLSRPLPRRSQTRRPTKVPESYVVPNLAHRDYRKLNWGLAHVNLPRTTLPSALHRAVSLTSSQLRWKQKPLLTEQELERLDNEYRLSGSTAFCHRNNPLITHRSTMHSLQRRIHQLTRSPIVYLNDQEYLEQLKLCLLREQAEKAGEAFEAGDTAPRNVFKMRKQKPTPKTTLMQRLVRSISPALPMPYVPESVRKPIRSSSGPFVITPNNRRSRQSDRAQKRSEESPRQDVMEPSEPLYNEAISKLYLGADYNEESVGNLIERMFPNQNQMDTLYDLADRALRIPSENEIQVRRVRSETPRLRTRVESREKPVRATRPKPLGSFKGLASPQLKRAGSTDKSVKGIHGKR